MFLAGGNIDVIARAQLYRLLCLGLGIDEQQIGFALYDQDPLMFILIVPLSRCCLMSVRENALYPQVVGTDQILKEFGRQWRGD